MSAKAVAIIKLMSLHIKTNIHILYNVNVATNSRNQSSSGAKSGCEYYQCDIPVVFTNNTFSSAAINLAKNTNVDYGIKILYHYLKNLHFLTKSLPLYYPLFAAITTAILSYYYLQHQD